MVTKLALDGFVDKAGEASLGILQVDGPHRISRQ